MKTLLVENGRLKLQTIEGREALAQRLRLRMQLYTGEWILAMKEGTDWFSMGDRPHEDDVRKAIIGSLSRDPDVQKIVSLSVEWAKTTEQAKDENRTFRKAYISAVVQTTFGTIAVSA